MAKMSYRRVGDRTNIVALVEEEEDGQQSTELFNADDLEDIIKEMRNIDKLIKGMK